MNISELAIYLNLNFESPQRIHHFQIDSRRIEPGDVFIAFKGQYQDGHDFAKSAEEQGAVAIIAEHALDEIHIPVLVVENSFKAVTQAAKAYRQKLHPLMLALTGSNGKTTVKEILSCIMPSPCYASLGNFNNQLGVPLNILNMPQDLDYAIFELGASQAGDIAYTAALVKPQIALINNIGPAHLSGFGSVEGVAAAKGEIYQSLASDGIAVVNADDVFSHFWDEIIGSRSLIRYSSLKKADVWADKIEARPNGTYAFNLHLGENQAPVVLGVAGRHQVQNALAAAAMAYAAKIDLSQIVQGLLRFQGVKGRMNLLFGYRQSHIIDDTYNANLASVKAGLDYLSSRPGEKILVIGDLAELGDYTAAQHQEIGKIAKSLGIDKLLALGQATPSAVLAFGSGALHFSSADELVFYLKENLHSDAHVLIKGSRSAKMEEIVQKITN
jgi:UDP-N-acetylmuramoyl-tripeptide--D-alanyl-D-alanine ligase